MSQGKLQTSGGGETESVLQGRLIMGFRLRVVCVAIITLTMMVNGEAGDTNRVFEPCADTVVQRSDGFTIGLAFAPNDSFFVSNTQYSPCDKRLSLTTNNSQVAIFRPKVDELSLLTINTTAAFSPENFGGYIVAFAGYKYAARSFPRFVADQTQIITSFTLVLDFKSGRLQNLYWKTDGCHSCKKGFSFVCYNGEACAININDCKTHGGEVDCILGIQLAFSGTDRHYAVLNSWYEVNNMRQYSLFRLFRSLRDSLTSQYNYVF